MTMNRSIAVPVAIALAFQIAAARAQSPEEWFRNGRAAVEKARQEKPVTGHARNVILFLGDGMGISTTVTAARILEGQQHGMPGEENLLSFEKFPNVGLSKTYSANQQTSDSAPTMSAIVTRHQDQRRPDLGERACRARRFSRGRRQRHEDHPGTRRGQGHGDGRGHHHAGSRMPRRPRATRTRPTATGKATPTSRTRRTKPIERSRHRQAVGRVLARGGPRRGVGRRAGQVHAAHRARSGVPGQDRRTPGRAAT